MRFNDHLRHMEVCAAIVTLPDLIAETQVRFRRRVQQPGRRKQALAEEVARTRGWKSFAFEIAELVETPA